MTSAAASPSALEIAFGAQRARLLRFLGARGAGDAAEDILQDLWLRLAAVEDPALAAMPSYMMRAADRLMIDRYRANRQAVRRDAAWAESQPGMIEDTSPAPSAERTLAARDEMRVVQQALAELDPRAAAIFRRHRIEGETQRTIATSLGISLSTVESDLRGVYRMLTDLRSRLDEA